MAERIHYTVNPPKTGPDAHEALERLLQALHEGGVLRFATDFVAAKTPIAEVLVDGLNTPGSLNAIQNLAILLMALSRIEPAQFYKIAFAAKAALDGASAWQPDDGKEVAPGVSGAYKMLHDESLWHALAPLIAALKSFSTALAQDVEKPISAFTGKESNA